MRYLIIPKDSEPFFTHWCDEEKFPMNGGIAFDCESCMHTTNGKDWEDTEEDHL